MHMDPKTYRRFADAHAPHSPMGKNCALAFLVGGSVCTLGQALRAFFQWALRASESDAGTLASITLILLAVLLTGLGYFDRIAKLAGAGTLVPITGFANAVSSAAIDNKSEGYVLGVGAKMFTIAGPVIVFGLLSGAIYGVIYYIAGVFL